MADWKIGIRYEMLPGDGVVERCRNAARFGFDVIELPGRYLHDYRDDLEANLENLALPISSLSLGFRGSLASADAASRSECRESTKALLAFWFVRGPVEITKSGKFYNPAVWNIFPRFKHSDRTSVDIRGPSVLALIPDVCIFK